MRKRKITFFVILLFLTALLVLVIASESGWFNNQDDNQIIEKQNTTDTYESDEIEMNDKQKIQKEYNLFDKYQDKVQAIILNMQQQVLQQSITREEAIIAINEDLLEIDIVPEELRDFHFRLILALSSDLSGQLTKASTMYEQLKNDYSWLDSELDYLLQFDNDTSQ